MNIELLQQLCEASAVSGDEQEVRDILINTLEPCVNEITFDGLGSFVARKGNKGPKVAVVGHMDEVGFMVTHIDESGFLRFTTIGGWWNQSMLNHRVTIRTHKGFKIPGVIGSVAPHALTEKQKQQPLSFDEMFIDIGANSRDEVEKRGVAMGDFISPEANFACWGEDKVVGKALDNRIGCAMMAELLQTVNNPEITLYGVGSVEEEVGLRGAQTSAEHIKPDVVIVLDTAAIFHYENRCDGWRALQRDGWRSPGCCAVPANALSARQQRHDFKSRLRCSAHVDTGFSDHLNRGESQRV